MASTASDSISVIVPTFNRASAITAAVTRALALPKVQEIVVVVDGSTDDTVEVLDALADDRVRVILHETNRGQSAARNTGWHAATAPWVLFADDDDVMPPDYTEILLRDAAAHGADLIAGPWVNALRRPAHEVAADLRRAPHTVAPTWRASHTYFTPEPVETPYLPPNVLVRTSVRDTVTFPGRFKGNAYREETAFFLEAAASGFRCVLTPNTYCWRDTEYGGGAHLRSRLRYEWYVLWNTWLFLRRYRGQLRRAGEIRTATGAQAWFVVERVASVLSGMVRARRR